MARPDAIIKSYADELGEPDPYREGERPFDDWIEGEHIPVEEPPPPDREAIEKARQPVAPAAPAPVPVAPVPPAPAPRIGKAAAPTRPIAPRTPYVDPPNRSTRVMTPHGPGKLLGTGRAEHGQESLAHVALDQHRYNVVRYAPGEVQPLTPQNKGDRFKSYPAKEKWNGNYNGMHPGLAHAIDNALQHAHDHYVKMNGVTIGNATDHRMAGRLSPNYHASSKVMAAGVRNDDGAKRPSGRHAYLVHNPAITNSPLKLYQENRHSHFSNFLHHEDEDDLAHHEVGHLVQRLHPQGTATAEKMHKELYDKFVKGDLTHSEMHKHLGMYGISNPSEVFAEAYRMHALGKKIPKKFQFLSDHIESLRKKEKPMAKSLYRPIFLVKARPGGDMTPEEAEAIMQRMRDARNKPHPSIRRAPEKKVEPWDIGGSPIVGDRYDSETHRQQQAAANAQRITADSAAALAPRGRGKKKVTPALLPTPSDMVRRNMRALDRGANVKPLPEEMAATGGLDPRTADGRSRIAAQAAAEAHQMNRTLPSRLSDTVAHPQPHATTHDNLVRHFIAHNLKGKQLPGVTGGGHEETESDEPETQKAVSERSVQHLSAFYNNPVALPPRDPAKHAADWKEAHAKLGQDGGPAPKHQVFYGVDGVRRHQELQAEALRNGETLPKTAIKELKGYMQPEKVAALDKKEFHKLTPEHINDIYGNKEVTSGRTGKTNKELAALHAYQPGDWHGDEESENAKNYQDRVLGPGADNRIRDWHANKVAAAIKKGKGGEIPEDVAKATSGRRAVRDAIVAHLGAGKGHQLSQAVLEAHGNTPAVFRELQRRATEKELAAQAEERNRPADEPTSPPPAAEEPAPKVDRRKRDARIAEGKTGRIMSDKDGTATTKEVVAAKPTSAAAAPLTQYKHNPAGLTPEDFSHANMHNTFARSGALPAPQYLNKKGRAKIAAAMEANGGEYPSPQAAPPPVADKPARRQHVATGGAVGRPKKGTVVAPVQIGRADKPAPSSADDRAAKIAEAAERTRAKTEAAATKVPATKTGRKRATRDENLATKVARAETTGKQRAAKVVAQGEKATAKKQAASGMSTSPRVRTAADRTRTAVGQMQAPAATPAAAPASTRKGGKVGLLHEVTHPVSKLKARVYDAAMQGIDPGVGPNGKPHKYAVVEEKSGATMGTSNLTAAKAAARQPDFSPLHRQRMDKAAGVKPVAAPAGPPKAAPAAKPMKAAAAPSPQPAPPVKPVAAPKKARVQKSIVSALRQRFGSRQAPARPATAPAPAAAPVAPSPQATPPAPVTPTTPAPPPSRADNLARFMEGAHHTMMTPEGKPRVFYHGAQSGNFRHWDTTGGERQSEGRGAYFTSRPELASGYAESSRVAGKPLVIGEHGPNVKPVHLNLKNPANLATLSSAEGIKLQGMSAEERTAWLQERGHDGVVIHSREHPGHLDEVIAFHPHQIKSASGNRGTFDPRDPDITKSTEETMRLRPEQLSGVERVRARFRELAKALPGDHREASQEVREVQPGTVQQNAPHQPDMGDRVQPHPIGSWVHIRRGKGPNATLTEPHRVDGHVTINHKVRANPHSVQNAAPDGYHHYHTQGYQVVNPVTSRMQVVEHHMTVPAHPSTPPPPQSVRAKVRGAIAPLLKGQGDVAASVE